MTTITMQVKSTITIIEVNGVSYHRLAAVKDDGNIVVMWNVENQGKTPLPLPKEAAEHMEANYQRYESELQNHVVAERIL